MYQHFIGIDISKSDFVVALHGKKDVHTFSNNEIGYEKFFQIFCPLLPKALVILETTGGFEALLIAFLQKQQICVHRANTRKVKHFIHSLGKLGKSDKIDALGLAAYGYERQTSLALFQPKSSIELEIQHAVERRIELKKMLVQEKNRLKAPIHTSLKASFERMIHLLQEELAQIEQLLKSLLASGEHLPEKMDIIQEIPGIGAITAISLLALLPELGQLNRREIASLAGVAPHPYESGKKIGYRKTRGGRQNIKPILFMAALTASRSKSQLGAFYQKLVLKGKKKMVALTALMRKILVIANAKLKAFIKQNGGDVLNAL